MHILVTGAAGFIGYHTCRRLLDLGHSVVGIDNLNAYYSPRLKEDRLAQLAGYARFVFHRMDLADSEALFTLFSRSGFSHVVNLAAQAGVRYSLINPASYIQSNIVGFANVLEACRHNKIEHLVYASSSSVYGLNSTLPFSTADNVDHPVSLYAASKKSNELMAHSYSYLYALPCTGLRFFTVYGPWGRPDMALYIFTQAIMEGRPMPVFNQGQMRRDFTYIDDITRCLVEIIPEPAKGSPEWSSAHPDPSKSCCPYAIYNIGNNTCVPLMEFIHTLEECLGKKAIIDYQPMQAGDVTATYADVTDLQRDFHFSPSTPLKEGLQRFADWYREYHHIE
jgi:UDP-glucuronate 4-epimerase